MYILFKTNICMTKGPIIHCNCKHVASCRKKFITLAGPILYKIRQSPRDHKHFLFYTLATLLGQVCCDQYVKNFFVQGFMQKFNS
jgi:hypothetical protein